MNRTPEEIARQLGARYGWRAGAAEEIDVAAAIRAARLGGLAEAGAILHRAAAAARAQFRESISAALHPSIRGNRRRLHIQAAGAAQQAATTAADLAQQIEAHAASGTPIAPPPAELDAGALLAQLMAVPADQAATMLAEELRALQRTVASAATRSERERAQRIARAYDPAPLAMLSGDPLDLPRPSWARIAEARRTDEPPGQAIARLIGEQATL